MAHESQYTEIMSRTAPFPSMKLTDQAIQQLIASRTSNIIQKIFYENTHRANLKKVQEHAMEAMQGIIRVMNAKSAELIRLIGEAKEEKEKGEYRAKLAAKEQEMTDLLKERTEKLMRLQALIQVQELLLETFGKITSEVFKQTEAIRKQCATDVKDFVQENFTEDELTKLNITPDEFGQRLANEMVLEQLDPSRRQSRIDSIRARYEDEPSKAMLDKIDSTFGGREKANEFLLNMDLAQDNEQTIDLENLQLMGKLNEFIIEMKNKYGPDFSSVIKNVVENNPELSACNKKLNEQSKLLGQDFSMKNIQDLLTTLSSSKDNLVSTFDSLIKIDSGMSDKLGLDKSSNSIMGTIELNDQKDLGVPSLEQPVAGAINFDAYVKQVKNEVHQEVSSKQEDVSAGFDFDSFMEGDGNEAEAKQEIDVVENFDFDSFMEGDGNEVEAKQEADVAEEFDFDSFMAGDGNEVEAKQEADVAEEFDFDSFMEDDSNEEEEEYSRSGPKPGIGK